MMIRHFVNVFVDFMIIMGLMSCHVSLGWKEMGVGLENVGTERKGISNERTRRLASRSIP